VGDALKDRVAIVTGSGRGIGREHALAMAAEGAKIVVNDIGVERDGSGGTIAPADEVVALIREGGGEAIANYESVADYVSAGRIVASAIDEFGRLDILVQNAFGVAGFSVLGSAVEVELGRERHGNRRAHAEPFYSVVPDHSALQPPCELWPETLIRGQ